MHDSSRGRGKVREHNGQNKNDKRKNNDLQKTLHIELKIE
jgi:hypothetical protein